MSALHLLGAACLALAAVVLVLALHVRSLRQRLAQTEAVAALFGTGHSVIARSDGELGWEGPAQPWPDPPPLSGMSPGEDACVRRLLPVTVERAVKAAQR